MGYVTISARIRRELYEKLKRYGIVVSDVIRKALEEEVKRREEEEVREALRRAQELLLKIPPEEIVSIIRSGREER
ncbi:MAG: type II toxin-antitoxin system CcdA family antitoxin [Desulfurococcales archaeon]|nr:type II toxin-antitoxin system CcdA family antitoxin [Desulfurococcales archaeon]